ncbi:MAG: ribonuclease HII [Coriobacteriales bacterium]|jgi:ribonuclease HII
MAYTKNVKEIVDQLKVADEEQFAKIVEEYGDDPRAGLIKAISTARRRLDKERKEHDRVEAMYEIMRKAGDDKVVVGIDEVGRGSIAGPLTVGAVVLPNEPIIEGLNDSKKLTPKQREQLAEEIRQKAHAVGIAHIPPREIDANGMAASLRTAMLQAIDNLGLDPDFVLIDGNPVHIHPNERCIVKGDAKVACIAAASIVAKVTRDQIMIDADKKYPGYHFADNKGYGSPQHIEAIQELGLCDFHRASFCTSFTQGTLF